MASEELFSAEFSEEITNRQNELDVAEETVETTEADTFDDKEFDQIESTELEENDANTPSTSNTVTNENSAGNATGNNQEARLIQLPIARIRNLMKLDPEMNTASIEAVFLITRSTEYFIESLAREAYSYTAQAKKKTVQKRDVDLAISSVDSLMFLDGAINF